MKAILQATYGSTNVHDFRNIDKPEMADDEALAHTGLARVCGIR